MDWCMAGIVARGDEENHSRHYASMAFDGDDLVVLSRSSDARALPSDPARRCHDGNVITCHVVENFRDLVYI